MKNSRFLSTLSVIMLFSAAIQIWAQKLSTSTLQYLDIYNSSEVNALLDFFSNKDIQKETNLTPEIIQTKYIQHNKGWMAENRPEKTYQIILAKINDQIVGVTIAYIYDNGKCYFQTIIVDKRFRRQKIASQMLQKLEENPQIKQIIYSATTDNIAACKFIESQQAVVDQFLYLIKLLDSASDYNFYTPYTVQLLDNKNQRNVEKICNLLNEQGIKEKVNSSNSDYSKELSSGKLLALCIFDRADQLCGVLCYFFSGEICKTSGLAVAKNYRGQNIAKNLILSLHQKAIENSCTSIETQILFDNTPAINCYKFLGFVAKEPQIFRAKRSIHT